MPVEYKIIDKLCSIDPTMPKDVFVLFKDQFTKELPILIQKIEVEEFEDVRKSSHKLKSTAGTIGCLDLMKILNQIENLILDGNFQKNDLKDLYQKLHDQYLNDFNELDQYFQKN